MQLLVERLEAVQRAEAVIFFGGKGPAVVEVVSNASGRVVLEIAGAAGIVRIEDGVVNDVPRVQMKTNDRPDFGGNRSGLPVVLIDAEFKIDGVKNVWS